MNYKIKDLLDHYKQLQEEKQKLINEQIELDKQISEIRNILSKNWRNEFEQDYLVCSENNFYLIGLYPEQQYPLKIKILKKLGENF